MVRAVTISPEQVNAAADALAAEGIKISSRSVRDRLGDDVALATISKLLRRRRAGQEKKAAAPLELPSGLRRAILDFVDTELGQARADHAQVYDEQQQELNDLSSENEAQLDTIDSQAAELALLKQELEQERQVAQQARTDLAKAQLRLEGMPRLEEAAEKARMDLAKAQFKLEDIPRLEAAADEARAQLVQAELRMESMKRLEAEVATLRSELEAERYELSETRAELDEERELRIKAQQFIVDPIFKRQA